MFRLHKRIYSNLLLCADLGAGFAAFFLAYRLRSIVPVLPLEINQYFFPEILPLSEYFLYFLVFLPFWMGLLLATQRYDDVLHIANRRQLGRIANFLVLSGFLMGFLAFTLRLQVSRPILFGFLTVQFILLPLNRIVLSWVLKSRNLNEHNQIKILIVGTGQSAARLARQIEKYRPWGYHLLGHISVDEEVGKSNLPILGKLEDLPSLLLADIVADEIIFIGSEIKDRVGFSEMLRLCEEIGLRTHMATDFLGASHLKVSIDYMEDLPLITFSAVPDHDIARIAKRVVDFVVAGISLVGLAPLMLLVALAIRMTSNGPILYHQTRCGLYGRKFRLIKFRTMVDGAEDRLWEIRHLNEMDGPVFKMRNDPRVTRLGRFLRKLSIDELPQFWNVVKGEMSVVGPRAPLPDEVAHYTLRQRRRLSVKPGITCLWQVSGRSEIDFEQWMALDLQYIDNWSFGLDMLIMLRTIPAVFTGRGAR